MEISGPVYLQPIVNPLTNICYKKTPMGINSINSMMKDLISNSPLQNSEKHLANHSARKTLVKKLKQQQVPKSKIISISRHDRETGSKNNCPILLTTITPMHPNINIPSLQITQYSKSIVFLLSK